ncbi:MAG: hypothetical protein KAU36_01370 [candidate division Zixibacteria bacterium]|nr:hypothetical protein [candidate division Zixibacteria bacterium]
MEAHKIQNLNLFSKASRYGLTLAALALLVLAVGCGSQGGANLDSQIAVAEASEQAVRDLDWAAYAKLLHPDELASTRQMLMPGIDAVSPPTDSLTETDTIGFFGAQFNALQMRTAEDEEFFAVLMDGLFASTPDLQVSFRGMTSHAVGAVAEGDTLVHVVMRSQMRIQMRDVDEVMITTLRKYGDEWRVEFSTQVEGIIFTLHQGVMQMTQRRP